MPSFSIQIRYHACSHCRWYGCSCHAYGRPRRPLIIREGNKSIVGTLHQCVTAPLQLASAGFSWMQAAFWTIFDEVVDSADCRRSQHPLHILLNIPQLPKLQSPGPRESSPDAASIFGKLWVVGWATIGGTKSA